MDLLTLIIVGGLGVSLGSIVAPALAVALAFLEDFLKRLWKLLLSLVIVSKEIGEGEAAMMHYLFRKVPFRNLGAERYALTRQFVRPLNEIVSVWLRRTDTTWRYARYRGAPILYLPGDTEGMARVLFLRGTLDFDSLLKDVAQDHHDRIKATDGTSRRFCVIRYTAGEGMTVDQSAPAPTPMMKSSDELAIPVGWRPEDLGLSVEGARTSDLSLTPSMQRVLHDVRFWHAKEEWYRERSIAWRRGYLLYGQPGGGKTSLVRALAEELDMPVYQFDLSGMSNRDFVAFWERCRRAGSRIVLFEDFDTVFHGRENVSQADSGGLTFDTILNSLDGIEREDGLLLFVTTNCVDQIDPALGAPAGDGRSTRPGRIDMTVAFEPLGHAGRTKIARRILQDDVLAERLAREGATDSPAQLTERCVTFAMGQLDAERAGADVSSPTTPRRRPDDLSPEIADFQFTVFDPKDHE